MPKKNFILRPYRPGDENRLDWRDDTLLKIFAKTLAFWQKYFRYEIIGEENLPRRGGVMLVNNHGLIPFDMLLLSRRLLQIGRPPRGMAEHATWKMPVLREILLNMGVVDGNPKNAMRLLRAGEVVVVFPGGAREGLKSSRQRYELFWEERYGFIKVAIAAGAPIVPCFSAGIDHCYYVFANAYDIGQSLVGTYVPLPLFMGVGAMPFPVKLTHYIGKPIRHNLPRKAYRDKRKVTALHRRVFVEMLKLRSRALGEYGVAGW